MYSVGFSLSVLDDPYVVQAKDTFTKTYAGKDPNSPLAREPEDTWWWFVSDICEHVAALNMTNARHPGTLFWHRWWRDQAEIFAPTPKENSRICQFTPLLYIDTFETYEALQALKRTVFLVAGLRRLAIPPSTYFNQPLAR